MRRTLTLIATLSLALAVALPSAAQPVPDGFGIRLLEVPAARSDDPRARSYVIDHVRPGTTLEREFEIANGSDRATHVELYAALAEISADAFLPAGTRQQNELSSWITVEPPSLRMAPRSRASATLRIDVPPDAEEGERYAVVLAEQAPPEDVADGQIGVASRVGVRVYLSVGPGGEPVTDFQITSLTAMTRDDRVRVVRAEVTNTGGRALDFSGHLTLSAGPGGLSAGPFEVTPGTTLAPAQAIELDVVLDASIPGGPWQAALRLTSGTLVREARAQLVFPDQPGAAAEPRAVETVGGEERALLVAGVVLLILLGAALAFWWLTRRRRGAPDRSIPPPPAPRPLPPPDASVIPAPPPGRRAATPVTPPPPLVGAWRDPAH